MVVNNRQTVNNNITSANSEEGKNVKTTIYVLELPVVPLLCDRSGLQSAVRRPLHWLRRSGNDMPSTHSAYSLCASDQCLGILAGSCSQ